MKLPLVIDEYLVDTVTIGDKKMYCVVNVIEKVVATCSSYDRAAELAKQLGEQV